MKKQVSRIITDEAGNPVRVTVLEDMTAEEIAALQDPIEVVKANAVLAVDAERARRTRDGFSFAGTSYQLDEASTTLIAGAGADARFAVLAGAQPGNLQWAIPGQNFGWIATDNTTTQMDAQTMSAFADAAKVWITLHIFTARAIKDAILAAADAEAVKAVLAAAVWPSSNP
jgi:hypothetical protein